MGVNTIKENNMKNLEIVKFNNGDFELDVSVSPSEDTVWLSLKELCTLYGRDKSVISRHINNIFKEKELDRGSTVAKNATVQFEGDREIRREIEYFNLDLIISLGYRVHSKNGILFRKWANRVLKDYLIKGYVVNPKKIEITVDDWNMLNTHVKYLESKITKIEEDIDRGNISDRLFFEGEFYNARHYLGEILNSAKHSVVIVDPYFDKAALSYLTYLNKGVKIEVFTSLNKMNDELEVELFRKQNALFKLFITNSFHDRFIIIDETKCYQIGTSLNSVGSKTFGVTQIKDAEYIDILQNRINQSKIA